MPVLAELNKNIFQFDLLRIKIVSKNYESDLSYFDM